MTRILVTNDDGVFSEGIRLLAARLSEIAEVVVVAPDREQSAMGHALTLSRPLRMQKIEEGWYAVDGTPTDCVNLAVLSLLKDDPPDLVVSGVNFGLNLGDDVTYSGTVSATFEGTLLGIPSVAFSQEVAEGFSFPRAAHFARLLVETLLGEPLPRDLLLNVNVPAGEIKGVSFTRLGRRVYKQSVVEKLDPRGRKYYWIAGTPQWEKASGTDYEAVSSGRISITPLHLDLTYYPGLESLGPLRDKLERVASLAATQPPAEGSSAAPSMAPSATRSRMPSAASPTSRYRPVDTAAEEPAEAPAGSLAGERAAGIPADPQNVSGKRGE